MGLVQVDFSLVTKKNERLLPYLNTRATNDVLSGKDNTAIRFKFEPGRRMMGSELTYDFQYSFLFISRA